MARIKIEDLPVLEDLSPKEVKGIFGGSISNYQAEIDVVSEDDSNTGDSLDYGSDISEGRLIRVKWIGPNAQVL